jgi:protein required for attachment to host cells
MTHFKLLHGAWVLIGDGQKALFLINRGDEKFPNLRCLSVEEHYHPPTRELGTDQPGRAFSSVGDIRSSVEEPDWHEIEEEHFAATIAGKINKAARAGSFDQLLIIAPPRILGDLRREFSKETEERIVGEVAKDYTNHPIGEIERLLLAG